MRMTTSILALSVAVRGGGSSPYSSQHSPALLLHQDNTFPACSAASGSLSLSKLGANYVTSTIPGITLKDGSSHYIVADDTQDNLYAVKLMQRARAH